MATWRLLIGPEQSKQRAFVVRPHHRAADKRDVRAAVAQKLVVELLPGLFAAARGAPVVPEFADHQLAERVVEIGWVERAAEGLLLGAAFVLVGDFEKQAF